MQGERFDALVQGLGDTSRRVLLAGAAGGLLTALPLSLASDRVDARRKRKQKRRIFYFTVDGMSGNQEVGHQGDPDGSGSIQITIRPRQLKICAVFHFHHHGTTPTIREGQIGQGFAGQNGPTVVSFLGPLTQGQKYCQRCTGAACSARTLNQIIKQPGAFFANILTNQFPLGAVRGQIHRG